MASTYAKSYTLSTPSVPTQLLALMQAADPAVANMHFDMVEMFQIQSSISNAAEVIVIGNSDVSASNGGVELYASQAFSVGFVVGDAIYIPSVWVFWVPTGTPPPTVRINFMAVIAQ